jgi:hypothetical protein
MQHADTLTVTRHDDTTEHYTDVRYTLTAAGLRILTADGTEQGVDAFDLLTTHATRQATDSTPTRREEGPQA